MKPLPQEAFYAHAEDGVRLGLVECAPQTGGRGTVLLIHGFGQNRRTFTEGPLPELLAQRGLRVVVGELRGHGRSSRPTTPWSLADHLKLDLPALVKAAAERGGGSVHLLGHSMGGILGYAFAKHPTPIASLTTFAAPVLLGKNRPDVRLLASLVAPGVARAFPRSVPIDQALRQLSRPLSRARPTMLLKVIQVATRLANPELAEPARIERVLAEGDRESPRVLRDLAQLAGRPQPKVGGVDLCEAVRRTPIPVCAIFGSRDVFSGKAAMMPILEGEHRGPRRLIEIPRAAHVDVTLAHALPQTMDEVLQFLNLGSVS